MKPILPKKLYNFSITTSLLMTFTFSLSLGLIFFSLSLIEGLRLDSKSTSIRHYSSHLQVRSSSYDPSIPFQTSGWWQAPVESLENASSIPNVRATTRRTVFTGEYFKNPIHIIGTSYSDDQVFSTLTSLQENALIPVNKVYIGTKLAQKFNIQRDAPFPIEIPEWDLTLSDLTVGQVLPPITPFIDNYAVYISTASLPNEISEKFTDYHVRYTGSVFHSLIISNVTPSIDNNISTTPDQKLEYQYHILKKIEELTMELGYILYFILGLIYGFLLYQRKHLYKDDIQKILYKQGILSIPTSNIKFFYNGLKNILLISFIALTISTLITLSKPEFYANPLISMTGQFEQFSLPLNYGFSPLINPIMSLQLLGIGVLLFELGIGSVLFLFLMISIILKSKNNTWLYFSFIIFFLAGFLATKESVYHLSANSGRQKQWVKNYFGNNTLFEKKYIDSFMFDKSPTLFSISSNLLEELETKKVPFFVSSEFQGEIEQLLDTSADAGQLIKSYSTNTYPVNIISFQSFEYDSILEEISPYLESNEIVAGSALSRYIPRDNVLLVRSKDSSDSNTRAIPIVINQQKEFKDKKLNSSIFIPTSRLNRIFGIEQISKLQILGNIQHLEIATNDSIIAVSAKESFSSWEILSNIVLFIKQIKTFFHTTVWFILLTMIFLYIKTHKKELLIFNYIHGVPDKCNAHIYFITLACYLSGVLLSHLNSLYFVIYGANLPKFLQLPLYTDTFTVFGIDLLGALVIIIGIIIQSILFYLIINRQIVSITARTYKYLYKEKIS